MRKYFDNCDMTSQSCTKSTKESFIFHEYLRSHVLPREFILFVSIVTMTIRRAKDCILIECFIFVFVASCVCMMEMYVT